MNITMKTNYAAAKEAPGETFDWFPGTGIIGDGSYDSLNLKDVD